MNLAEISAMTEADARAHFEKLRWPNGIYCAHCNSTNVVRMISKSARAGLLRCKDCRKQFTVTVGSIFEDSHISLRKWLMAIHLMCSSKKGISALQLKRNLGITYKCAWHLAHRIRFAMKQSPMRQMLRGAIEVDETYVGGKMRGGKRGRGSENKIPVLVVVERSGEARSRVIAHVDGQTLKGAIREMVNPDSTIHTDEWPAYNGIGKDFIGGHHVIRHRVKEYARGTVHTNTAECYFSLLKRGIVGAFHHVSKEHLHRYCDEFDFRWNLRKMADGDRTGRVVAMSVGKRLMYKTPVAERKHD